MKVKKAVIPAAGFGTRVLPYTKAMPKEMYPIVDKPAIHYVVEEAVASGITDILIIISRGKEIIENYFDVNPELENMLKIKNKTEDLEKIRSINRMANIHFIRQKQAKGLGDAISYARAFVGEEPFAVLSADDVIIGQTPVCRQLMDAFEEFRLPVVGAQKVPECEISRYGSLKVKNIRDNVFMCSDMVEKPTPDKVLSLYSILGRYILTADIFDILSNLAPGSGGEIQLTDALKFFANNMGVIAVDFLGKRYDIGNKLGALKATVEAALMYPEICQSFREYIKNLV